MNRNFEDILNECLERLSTGESVEACLKIYPDEAERLASMLKVAQATRQVASSLEPRSDFKAQALYRLSKEMARPQKAMGLLSTVPWSVFATPLLLGLGSLFIVFGGAVGVSAASSSSVPGDPLYLVKTAREWVLSTMPRSEMSRARLQAELAQTREEEIAELARRGDVDRVEDLTKRLDQHLEAATNIAVSTLSYGDNDSDARMLRGYLKEQYRQHQIMMQSSVQNAPPPVRPIMRKSLEESGHRLEQAISALGEGAGVFMAVNPDASYVIFKPTFGTPLFLSLNEDTEVYVNDSRASVSSLKGYSGSQVWVEYDPITKETQEIRFSQ